MAVLPICLFPDPILRERCAEVKAFNADLARLAGDMVETMYAAPGVGLAAPQIGVAQRLAVVDVTVGKDRSALQVLVNPRLTERQGMEVDVEGCLSIPGLTEKVSRPQSIKVVAQDLSGQPFELAAAGFLARAICHELDHLDGILFVDHLHGLRRDLARRHLRKLIKAYGTVNPTAGP